MAKTFGSWPYSIQTTEDDKVKMILHPKTDKATKPKSSKHNLYLTKSEFKILKEHFKLS